MEADGSNCIRGCYLWRTARATGNPKLPEPSNNDLAVLTALGRLGDPSALPKLQELRPTLWHESSFYRAGLARLQAEMAVPNPTTPAEWYAKRDIYLQAVELSIEDLAAHFRSELTRKRVIGDEWPSVEVLAVRHLVEMAANAYANGVREAFAALAAIDYTRDPVSELRTTLAKVAPKQRAAWLIEQLMRREVRTAAENYYIQALIDCGSEAVPLIVQAIEEAQKRKEVCTINLGMLLNALSAIEFWEGRPTLHRLAESGDPIVAEEARRMLKYALTVRASDW